MADVQGRKVAVLATDGVEQVENAGANRVDEVCVRDGKLVGSRKPDDMPEVNRHMLELLAEAGTQNRAAA